MKHKINKILAILTCIAIMVSIAVPIMAFGFPEDACFDDHPEGGHVSDCGNLGCSHGGCAECGGGRLRL